MGQLAGDSLGSLVEFQSARQIRAAYPDGVRELADGGVWGTLAGQPTDDSEMALSLARVLVERGEFDVEAVREAYVAWLDTGPFDAGITVSGALRGRMNPHSQANGALMRISPLAIFGATHELSDVATWARADAGITHPNRVCLEANELFAIAIAHVIRTGCDRRELYQRVLGYAEAAAVDSSLLEAVRGAAVAPPGDFLSQAGWVLIAFRNALWQLLHAVDLEEGVVDTVMRGGDTDTNAAICGALLGAVWGLDAIPAHWANAVLNCRADRERPGVRNPRPQQFWPVDALELAERLAEGQVGAAQPLGNSPSATRGEPDR